MKATCKGRVAANALAADGLAFSTADVDLVRFPESTTKQHLDVPGIFPLGATVTVTVETDRYSMDELENRTAHPVRELS